MAEVVSSDHLLNLETFINEYDNYFNESFDFDEYFNFEDTLEANNSTVNSLQSTIRYDNNNGFNPANNEWLPQNDLYFANNTTSNGFLSNPLQDMATERVVQPLVDSQNRSQNPTEIGCYLPNRVTEQFPFNPFNGFQLNDYSFGNQIGETPPPLISSTVTTQVAEELVQPLIQPVAQLSGELLSAQEFEKETNLNLFCEEKLEDSHHSSTNLEPIPRNESRLPSDEAVTEQISGIQEMSVVRNRKMKNQKTYSRAVKVVRVAPQQPPKQPPQQPPPIAPNTNISDETIAAVKGLVMLSNNVRQTIRPKAKKRNFSHLPFAERQRIKRERNRIASKKCRQKKLETIERLELMKELLIEENQKYEIYLRNYRQKLLEMKKILLFHRMNDCQLEHRN